MLVSARSREEYYREDTYDGRRGRRRKSSGKQYRRRVHRAREDRAWRSEQW